MLHRLLEIPAVYRLNTRLFNADGIFREVVRRSSYAPGMRVLDVGCGPGDLAKYIHSADYVGVDVSATYIDRAMRDYSGTFLALSAECVDQLDQQFDIAFILGLLHHLPDTMVSNSLSALRRVMRPTGRAYVIEAIWPSHRLDFAGYLWRKMDRGRFVRTPPQWRALYARDFRITDERITRNRIIENLDCVLEPRPDSSVNSCEARVRQETAHA